ncbi:MAG: hypothetical protein MUD06_10445 [Rhodospirillales bacterium]|jgi:hypothetical protein|nr:hypothetical protein [Rhodospirillales bacterium]
MLRRITDLWRGRLPLADAFWTYAIFWGFLINMATTLTSLGLVVADVPGWVAVLVHFAPLPWNLLVLFGVWRSAGRPEVSERLRLVARGVIVAWSGFLTLV